MAESRSEFEARLEREGRWREYCVVYEEFAGEEDDLGVARERAVALFPPLPVPEPLTEEELTAEKEEAEKVAAEPLRQMLGPEDIPKPKPGSGLNIDFGSLEWRRLRTAAGRKVSQESDDIRWVAANLEAPLELIDPDTVPSRTALGLFRWASLSGTTLQSFWTGLYKQLLPKKSQAEVQQSFRDDMRNLDDLMVQLQDYDPEKQFLVQGAV